MRLFDSVITKRGSLFDVLDGIQKVEFEYAKIVMDDIIQSLRETAYCINQHGLGRCEQHHSVQVPFIGIENIKQYFWLHAKDVLDFPFKNSNGMIICNALHNPYIELEVQKDVENGIIDIALYADTDQNKARKFIESRLKAECVKDILGYTKKELAEKYNKACENEEIKYYTFDDTIEYRGLVLRLVFQDGIVVSVMNYAGI